MNRRCRTLALGQYQLGPDSASDLSSAGTAASSSGSNTVKAPVYPSSSQAPAARTPQSSLVPLQPPGVSDSKSRPDIEAGQLANDDLNAKWHSVRPLPLNLAVQRACITTLTILGFAISQIWIDMNGSDPYRGGNVSLLSLRQSKTLPGWTLDWGGSYPALISKIRQRRAGNWLDGDSLLEIRVSRQTNQAGARRVSHLRFKEEVDRKAWTVWDFAKDLRTS